MPPLTPEEQLRKSIQEATDSTTLTLAGGPITPAYGFTLGQVGSLSIYPAAPGSGYTVSGAGATLLNTRIYQQNVDAKSGSGVPYSPGVVTGASGNLLTLDYSAGGGTDGFALFRAEQNPNSGFFLLDYLNFTGTHSGWVGNGNTYISLTRSLPTPPISINFTLSNSIVNIKGQGSFSPADSSQFAGGAAFIQSWNNDNPVTLDGNTFFTDEYLSAFQFRNSVLPTNPLFASQVYTISNNQFLRNANAGVVRRRGDRLENVSAVLRGNTWSNGNYLHLLGDIGSITFRGTNVFNSVVGGYGIRADFPVLNVATLAGGANLTFNGPGLPLYYNNNLDSATVFSITAPSGSNIFIYGLSFRQASAGGQLNSTITTSSRLWANGDLGNDQITGSTASLGDFLIGGQGLDTINGLSGPDTIDGGADADSLLGGTGNDSISGGDGPDFIDGGEDQDSLLGGNGLDTIFGGSGDDTIFSGAGNDSIDAGDGDDTVFGENAADTILGGAGDDFIDGGENGLSTWEVLSGGDGGDTIYGGVGIDSIVGNQLEDYLDGGSDNDVIEGNTQNDTIFGGTGDDTITGGLDQDVLTGGTGLDIFGQGTTDSHHGTLAGTFATTSVISFNNSLDIITDFSSADGDLLDLAVATFPVSALGIAVTAIVNGTNYYLSGNFNSVTSKFTVTADGGGTSTLIFQGYAGGSNFNLNFSPVLLEGTISTTLSAGNFI